MVKPPLFPQSNPHFVWWHKTHHWPITTQDFPNEPQLATSKFVAWQVESEGVIRATTLFNLQCNSVARQVERKCCPYYLTWTEINIKYNTWMCMDDHYYITRTWTLAQVQVQKNFCPCSALHLLDCHSSLKYRQQTWISWIWFLTLGST